MSLHLNGVALVTGAGTSIGRECALGYAAEGVRGIVLADSDYETALDAAQESETLATNPSFTAIAMRVDMTDLVSVAEMIGAIMRVFGRIDYYVNITGAQKRLSTAAMDREALERTRQASFEGTLHGIRAVTQVMKNQLPGKYKARGHVREGSRGTIITVGLRNLVVAERTAQDTIDEQGILDLTRKSALENAAHGIRVNAICPGLVENTVDPILNGSVDPQVMKSIVPLSRTARPEEIGDVVLFLSSPRASYVTGAAWTVDGGMALQANTAH
ncbi:hypothetical protein BJX62DRAFT_86277 [Aspergillus germanicus]